MTSTGPCFSTEVLAAFLARPEEVLNGSEGCHFETHIDQCSQCRNELSRLALQQWPGLPTEPNSELHGEFDAALSRIKDAVWSIVQPSEALPEIPGFRVTKELGRGGSAVVYHALQIQPPRAVAVKMLLDTRRSEARAVSRFRSEIDSIARLDHANIVPILEVGSFAQTVFYTMPFMSGGSLANQLKRQSFSCRHAARIIRDLARAAAAAHAIGLVHRDIKPDNVLLQPVDESLPEDLRFIPRLTDFGIAKQMAITESVTRTGEIVGTPCYMAPEQILGSKEPGPAADVYSLGAMLYELLTGRPPFQSHSSTETMLQALRDEPVPLRRLQARVPYDLARICEQAIARQVSQRYATAEQLADDLDRFLQGHPVRARRVGWGRRIWKWSQRQPVSASLLVALAVVCLSLLAIWGRFTWQLKQQRDLAEKSASQLAEEQKLNLQNFDEAFDAIRNYLAAVQASSQLASDDTIELRMELLETGSTFYTDLLQRNQRVSELPSARRTTEKIHLEQARLFFGLGKLNYSVGDMDQAVIQLETAQQICQRTLGDSEFPTEGSDAGLPGSISLSLSKAHLELTNFVACRQQAEAGLNYFERTGKTELLSPDYRNWYLAESWLRMAEASLATQRLDQAAQEFEQTLEFAGKLPGIPDFVLTRANGLTGLALVCVESLSTDEAVEHCRDASRLLRELVDKQPLERRYREALARSLWVESLVMSSSQGASAAAEIRREALEIQRELCRRFPRSQRLQQLLARMEQIPTHSGGAP